MATTAASGVTTVIESFEGIPRPPRVSIRREKLEALLADATHKPLTVLVAPAGSGKTAALAVWAESRGGRIRWLTAQPGASGRLLAAALLECSGGDANVDPAADDSAGFIAQLRAGSQQPDLLVVDDAQHLPRASWQLLDEAVSEAGDRVRVVVATRRDPPISRVSLELSDSLTVIRADALRFEDEEARRLVAVHAPNATMDDVSALQGRANGWAAALVLGARSLAGALDPATVRAGITHTDQPVLDYLLGEVFSTMPAGHRHVLLCTAGETVVTPTVAVMLSGDPDADQRLNDLAAEGLLVTALVTEAGVAWTYHPLLRALLRRQVSLDGPDHSLAKAAHSRAAHYHARNGPADAALRHAVEAGEHGLVRGLLIECGPALMTTGHEQLLWKALGDLGDDATSREPALLGVTALLLAVSEDREQSVRVATLAARAARAARDRLGRGGTASAADGALLADSAVLNAWLAQLGWHDIPDAMDGARAVLGESLLDERRAWSPVVVEDLEPTRLSWLQSELALLELWTDRPEDALRHIDEALVSAGAVGNRELVARALSIRAVHELLAGHIQTAAATARECLRTAAGAVRSDERTMARAHLALAWAAFFELRHHEIEASLVVIRRCEDRSYAPIVAVLRQVLEAWVAAGRGDVAKGRRLLAASASRPHPAPTVLEAVVATSRAHLALADGATDEAQTQSQPLRELGWHFSASVIDAVVVDRRGEPGVAGAKLARARSLTPVSVEEPSAVFGCVYQAQLLHRAERSAQALEAMREALTRAAPQRLLYPFVAAARNGASDRLLVELTTGEEPHPFAGYVLDRVRAHARGTADRNRLAEPGPAAQLPKQQTRERGEERAIDLRSRGVRAGPTTSTPTPLPPLPLTGREAEVLRELALGGSYRDVARVLYVTENTVKTHVSALYRKLGVERRADALRRARESGLI